MSNRSSSKTSKTDWPRVRALSDKEIRITREHPEADVRHIVNGMVRRGLKPVRPKTSISLRVDADVLAWFKAQGPGYQKRMNMVLRAFREESRRCEIQKIGTRKNTDKTNMDPCGSVFFRVP